MINLRTILILSMLATSVALIPSAEADPGPWSCAAEPEVWYETCDPVIQCVNGLVATPKRMCQRSLPDLDDIVEL